MSIGGQANSLSNRRRDPLTNFKFHVYVYTPETIQDMFSGTPWFGFSSVTGLGVNIGSTEYREAGVNIYTHEMPTQGLFSPVTLTSGVICGDDNTNQWMERVYAAIQGKRNYIGTTTDVFPDFRATVDICLVSHPATTATVHYKAMWRLFDAWPSAMLFGDLDAAGNGILLQQLTLKHGGFRFWLADRNDVGTSTVTPY